jgi:hypothetical protein
MSKRRSRSQRPQKARNSEAPPKHEPVVTRAGDPSEGRMSEPTAPSPTDELAALDAGWDQLMS